MNINISEKIKTTLLMFAAAFIVVMFLFIKKPHIVKSKNKYVKAVMVFAIAFIPGVMAASICAKTITTLYEKVFAENPAEIVCETEEKETKREEFCIKEEDNLK